MKTWFVCNVKYNKEDERGNIKKITQSYLVDAVSFTEAEKRIYEELESIISGDFNITGIARSNYADVFHYDDADTWFKCKVTYQTVDEDNGKDKKVTNYMLVSANNAKQAYERIEESLSTMIVPFEIPVVQAYQLNEVFVYDSQKIPKNLKPLSEIE